MPELVRYARRDEIAVVTIDNPPVNALSPGVPEGIAGGDRARSIRRRREGHCADRRGFNLHRGRGHSRIRQNCFGRTATAEPVAFPAEHRRLAQTRCGGHSWPSARRRIGNSDVRPLSGDRANSAGRAARSETRAHSGRGWNAASAPPRGCDQGAGDVRGWRPYQGVRRSICRHCRSRHRRRSIGRRDCFRARNSRTSPFPKRVIVTKICTVRCPCIFDVAREQARKRGTWYACAAGGHRRCRSCHSVVFRRWLQTGSELFNECLFSNQSKALIHVFFSERTVSQRFLAFRKTPRSFEIRRAAVIGAGTMGGGIAMTYANAGIPVIVKETAQEALDRGMEYIRNNYASTVAKGSLSQEAMERASGADYAAAHLRRL